MQNYLVYFDKIVAEDQNESHKFTGTVVLKTDTQQQAVTEFLDWIKTQQKFESTTKFYFEVKPIDFEI
jgi:formylmethanofuran dehydrogenase subunit E